MITFSRGCVIYLAARSAFGALRGFGGFGFAPGAVIIFLLDRFVGPHTEIIFCVLLQARDGFAGGFVRLNFNCLCFFEAAGSGILNLITGDGGTLFPTHLNFAAGGCFDAGERSTFGFAD